MVKVKIIAIIQTKKIVECSERLEWEKSSTTPLSPKNHRQLPLPLHSGQFIWKNANTALKEYLQLYLWVKLWQQPCLHCLQLQLQTNSIIITQVTSVRQSSFILTNSQCNLCSVKILFVNCLLECFSTFFWLGSGKHFCKKCGTSNYLQFHLTY